MTYFLLTQLICKSIQFCVPARGKCEGSPSLVPRGQHFHTSVRDKTKPHPRPFFNLRFVLDLERISYTRDLIVIAVQSINSTVGHNLGGEHPFYDEEIVKQGQTGGIMDYG